MSGSTEATAASDQRLSEKMFFSYFESKIQQLPPGPSLSDVEVTRFFLFHMTVNSICWCFRVRRCLDFLTSHLKVKVL